MWTHGEHMKVVLPWLVRWACHAGTINFCPALGALHCTENPIYVFLFWELRRLSPNFHIHVSEAIYLFPGLV
jgi:hypothetical protein